MNRVVTAAHGRNESDLAVRLRQAALDMLVLVFKPLVFVAFPIMLVGVPYTILTAVDRSVIAGYLGDDPLGHSSLAIWALAAVGLLPLVISRQFYPRMAHKWATGASLVTLDSLGTKQRWYALAVVLPAVAVLAPMRVHTFLPTYTLATPRLWKACWCRW